MLTLGSPNFHSMLTLEYKLTNKYSIGKLRIGKTTYEVIRLLTKWFNLWSFERSLHQKSEYFNVDSSMWFFYGVLQDHFAKSQIFLTFDAFFDKVIFDEMIFKSNYFDPVKKTISWQSDLIIILT
jgi:hypothetical protein